MTKNVPKRITIRLEHPLPILLNKARVAGYNISAIVRTAITEYLKNSLLDNSGNSQEVERA